MLPQKVEGGAPPGAPDWVRCPWSTLSLISCNSEPLSPPGFCILACFSWAGLKGEESTSWCQRQSWERPGEGPRGRN